MRISAAICNSDRSGKDSCRHAAKTQSAAGQIPEKRPGGKSLVSLLVVGSVAFDAIKTPYGKTDKILGGAATYFSLAASFFTQVRVVAVVGEDFTAREEKVFHDHNIDISGIAREKGQSFFWSGEYGENVNEAKTLDTQLGVFGN